MGNDSTNFDKRIDSILLWIEKSHERKLIMAEQYRRLEALMVKVADKVGVKPED